MKNVCSCGDTANVLITARDWCFSANHGARKSDSLNNCQYSPLNKIAIWNHCNVICHTVHNSSRRNPCFYCWIRVLFWFYKWNAMSKFIFLRCTRVVKDSNCHKNEKSSPKLVIFTKMIHVKIFFVFNGWNRHKSEKVHKIWFDFFSGRKHQ